MKVGDVVNYPSYKTKVQIIGYDGNYYMVKFTPPLGVSVGVSVEIKNGICKRYNVEDKYLQSETINVLTGVALDTLEELFHCYWCQK